MAAVDSDDGKTKTKKTKTKKGGATFTALGSTSQYSDDQYGDLTGGDLLGNGQLKRIDKADLKTEFGGEITEGYSESRFSGINATSGHTVTSGYVGGKKPDSGKYSSSTSKSSTTVGAGGQAGHQTEKFDGNTRRTVHAEGLAGARMRGNVKEESGEQYKGIDTYRGAVEADAELLVGAEVKAHAATQEGDIEFTLMDEDGNFDLGKGGYSAEAGAEARAGMFAEGGASADATLGGVKAGVMTEGEAGVGAKASGSGVAAFGPDTGYGASGDVEAFAGAKAGGSVSGVAGIGGKDIGKGTVGASVMAGVGVDAGGGAHIDKDGKFTGSLKLGAALGVGASLEVQVEFDPVATATGIKNQAEWMWDAGGDVLTEMGVGTADAVSAIETWGAQAGKELGDWFGADKIDADADFGQHLGAVITSPGGLTVLGALAGPSVADGAAAVGFFSNMIQGDTAGVWGEWGASRSAGMLGISGLIAKLVSLSTNPPPTSWGEVQSEGQAKYNEASSTPKSKGDAAKSAASSTAKAKSAEMSAAKTTFSAKATEVNNSVVRIVDSASTQVDARMTNLVSGADEKAGWLVTDAQTRGADSSEGAAVAGDAAVSQTTDVAENTVDSAGLQLDAFVDVTTDRGIGMEIAGFDAGWEMATQAEEGADIVGEVAASTAEESTLQLSVSPGEEALSKRRATIAEVMDTEIDWFADSLEGHVESVKDSGANVSADKRLGAVPRLQAVSAGLKTAASDADVDTLVAGFRQELVSLGFGVDDDLTQQTSRQASRELSTAESVRSDSNSLVASKASQTIANVEQGSRTAVDQVKQRASSVLGAAQTKSGEIKGEARAKKGAALGEF